MSTLHSFRFLWKSSKVHATLPNVWACPLQKTNCRLLTSFGQAFRFKVVMGSLGFNEMRLETMIRNP